jgi:diguanylate cyclase (GGDEF)-like protein
MDITSEPALFPGTMRHWHAFAFLLGESEIAFLAIEVTAQRRTEETLQVLSRRLESTIAEMEMTSVVNEMAHLLQTAKVTEEIYSIVGRYAPRLFPRNPGTLSVLNSSKDLVEVVAAWGPGANQESIFSPDDCWALRDGRPHLVRDPQSGLMCAHVRRETPSAELCVPMMAQYEALGILHLGSPLADGDREAFTHSELRLAEAVAHEISLPLANVKMREVLRDQALHDPLTGLYNRRYLEEALDREVRRAVRKQTAVGLIMLDVDNFKQLNDTHGHTAGDAMLRAVAGLLQSGVRAADVLCRYGGDEFSIIMPEASLDDTVKRAEDLRQRTKQLSLEINGRIVDQVTISLGAVAFPHHGSTLDELIKEADTALYAAKTSGRDQVKTNLPPMADGNIKG